MDFGISATTLMKGFVEIFAGMAAYYQKRLRAKMHDPCFPYWHVLEMHEYHLEALEDASETYRQPISTTQNKPKNLGRVHWRFICCSFASLVVCIKRQWIIPAVLFQLARDYFRYFSCQTPGMHLSIPPRRCMGDPRF